MVVRGALLFEARNGNSGILVASATPSSTIVTATTSQYNVR